VRRAERAEVLIVDVTHLGQGEAAGQVIEREEVDEVQVAQDVNDGAALRDLADRLHPGLVDLNPIEELAIQKAQRRIRLVAAFVGYRVARHRSAGIYHKGTPGKRRRSRPFAPERGRLWL
jgi:hypothetical protein